jgi:hypothetical protein
LGRPVSGAVRRRNVTGDGYPIVEKFTLIRQVLADNPNLDRLQTLEPGGWLEVRALLATV